MQIEIKDLLNNIIHNIENKKEVFKEIKDYEDYCISNFGRVLSKKNNKELILKQSLDKNREYNTVGLYSKGKRKSFTVCQCQHKT